MRSSLSCHLKSISGLLIVVFIFATLPVCRVAALETASICLAYFHVVWKQEGCYYCSEFVGELLTKSRVDGTEQLRSSIIQPMQFLRMPHTLLYCGKLREYVCDPCSEDICEDIMNRTVHRRLP